MVDDLKTNKSPSKKEKASKKEKVSKKEDLQ